MSTQPPTPSDRPLSLADVRGLPAGPIAQFTTEELTSFVAHISLLAHGQPEFEQAMLRARMGEAMDELKSRGIELVAMAHWNFGRASRTPAVPRNYPNRDADWYKRPSTQQNVLHATGRTYPDHWCHLTQREEREAKRQRQYQNYVARFERSDRRKGWMRFLVRHPVAALTTALRGQPLPRTWRRKPLSEAEYEEEQLGRALQSISTRD